jgi:UDP-glucuronate decarboxylase
MRSETVKTKTVLVAGAAGFLGANLVSQLLSEGVKVVALDNLQTGTFSNLKQHLDNPGFSFLEADITTPISVTVDEIFNLACPASPPHYQSDPVRTLKTSVIGTLNLLELAASTKAKVVHASTSEVYGDPLQHPQQENYWGNVNPIGIRACYDEGKRAAETLCFDFRRTRGVDAKVVRIFNTYGPFMHPDDGRVVSNFIVQTMRGQDLTIYGDGSQTRSFCYVDDLIGGLLKVAQTGPDVSGPINLGNPNEFSMLQLAERVQNIMGSSGKLVFKPLPIDDPRQRRPDISRAKQILDWQPETQLTEGLEKTIGYFRKRLQTQIESQT